MLGKGVGDVFQENQTQNQMLVFRCIHLGTKFVGTRPEHGLEILGGCFLLRSVAIGGAGGRCSGQSNGTPAPAPLADQPHGQQALLHLLIGLLADLGSSGLAQGLPGRKVAQAAAIAGEHLQQQIAQIFLSSGLSGNRGGGVGHGLGQVNSSVAKDAQESGL